MCSDALSNFLSHVCTQTSLRPLLITSHLQAWKLSLLEDLTQTEAVTKLSFGCCYYKANTSEASVGMKGKVGLFSKPAPGEKTASWLRTSS